MKVILLKSIQTLGKEGQVVTVKDGYSRNYLIPQGLALVATNENLKRFDKIKNTRLKFQERAKEKALVLKEKLESTSITLTVEAKDDDEIYGSINETHIIKALKEEGIELEQKRLKLDEPIRKLGVYNLTVDLGVSNESTLRVWVVKR